MPAPIATKVTRVTQGPPQRSASLPPTGRSREPSSGPRKVSAAALTGVSKRSWNCTWSTWPKANPKPMNEPKVPMYRVETAQP